MKLDVSQCKTKPFAHQVEDVNALLSHSAYALFSEMGTGKSKTVIDAACVLASHGVIDTVVVVCPASVRSVWCDKEIGEVKKHAWVPVYVSEYANGKMRFKWDTAKTLEEAFAPHFIITNYEILRGAKHLEYLIGQLKDRKTLLVFDESSYIKSRTAHQTKAALKLRKHCVRCICLNGTPVINSPLDLWSQCLVLSDDILLRHYKSFWCFRAEHCEMIPQRFGNVRFNKIVRYRRLDALQKKIAPYCVRRLKADCLDLPPKIYTQREVVLTPESWARYKQLKNEAVVALEGSDSLHLEPNAAVRIMRLAQLTSGHYGAQVTFGSNVPEKDKTVEAAEKWQELGGGSVVDVSSEKLYWCVNYLVNESTARYVICWCRWRRERERLAEMLYKANPPIQVSQVYGGQNTKIREQNITWFMQSENEAMHVLLAQPHAAGFGLNLQAATECIYLSNDFSYGIRLQSEDRAHRPGQMHPVTYLDVLAVGPKGQTTIDHIITKALTAKASLAEMTTGMWRRALCSEDE